MNKSIPNTGIKKTEKSSHGFTSNGTHQKSSKTNRKLDLDKEQKLEDLVHKFNMVITGMVKLIVDYYGDPNVASMQMILIDIINETPNELISYFLLNIYKNDDYRENILKQNDKFFLDQEYEEFTSEDNDKIA